MKLDPQTRDILRQYKALINARRRDSGQRDLTTAQVVDEICYYMTLPVCGVYRRALHPAGRKGGVILRQAVMPPVSPRAKPCRLAPAGEGHAPRFAPLPVLFPCTGQAYTGRSFPLLWSFQCLSSTLQPNQKKSRTKSPWTWWLPEWHTRSV